MERFPHSVGPCFPLPGKRGCFYDHKILWLPENENQGGRGGIIGADPRFGGQKDPEKWPVKRAGAGRQKGRPFFVYSDGLQKATRNPLRKINI